MLQWYTIVGFIVSLLQYYKWWIIIKMFSEEVVEIVRLGVICVITVWTVKNSIISSVQINMINNKVLCEWIVCSSIIIYIYQLYYIKIGRTS